MLAVYITEAGGGVVVDVDGNSLIDFGSGIAVTNVGNANPRVVKRVTGYVRYTITPFGSTKPWPVIADAALLEQPVVAIGGGARGVNLHLAPGDLVSALGAEIVDVTVPDPGA